MQTPPVALPDKQTNASQQPTPHGSPSPAQAPLSPSCRVQAPPAGAQIEQLQYQQSTSSSQTIPLHGYPSGTLQTSWLQAPPTGAQVPQVGLQQYSPASQIVPPQRSLAFSQNWSVQAPPGGMQIPQLGLQQTSPGVQIMLPHGSPPEAWAAACPTPRSRLATPNAAANAISTRRRKPAQARARTALSIADPSLIPRLPGRGPRETPRHHPTTAFSKGSPHPPLRSSVGWHRRSSDAGGDGGWRLLGGLDSCVDDGGTASARPDGGAMGAHPVESSAPQNPHRCSAATSTGPIPPLLGASPWTNGTGSPATNRGHSGRPAPFGSPPRAKFAQ